MDEKDMYPATSAQSDTEISKLRKKLKRMKVRADVRVEKEGEEVAQQIKNAKVITLYPKEKCIAEKCKNNAVGDGDLCRKHGGNPVIRENLLLDEEIPDAVMTGTKYDPSYHPIQFVLLAREGMNEVEVAAQFGVSVYTMRGWAETFDAFNGAYEIGQAMYEAWWQQEGKINLSNSRYNTGLFKYLTMNNLGWSDKVESKNLNINAGVMIAPQKMEPEDWEKKYAKSDSE